LFVQTNVPTLLAPNRSSGSHCTQGWLGSGVSTDGCGVEGNSCRHQGSKPNRSVASRNTDYTIPVHFSYTKLLFIPNKMFNILSTNQKKHKNTLHKKFEFQRPGITCDNKSLSHIYCVPVAPKIYVPKCTCHSLPGIIRLPHIFSDKLFKTDRIHTEAVTSTRQWDSRHEVRHRPLSQLVDILQQDLRSPMCCDRCLDALRPNAFWSGDRVLHVIGSPHSVHLPGDAAFNHYNKASPYCANSRVVRIFGPVGRIITMAAPNSNYELKKNNN
jgi:hypothetical protein